MAAPLRVLAWPAFRKRAANPHAALLCEQLRAQGVAVADWTPARAALGRADLWHLHHPDTVLYPRSLLRSLAGTLIFAALLALARRRGTRILWTVHDLGSHDRLHPRLEAWFWRFFVPRVDAWIGLSERSRDLVGERFPELRRRASFVVAHGHYRDAYPQRCARGAARRALGLPGAARVMLHFGLLRPYKNVPLLIERFRQLAGDDHRLLIAGRPYDAAIRRAVERAAAGDARIALRLSWVPPDEVAQLFAACDLVVLPYRRILNSGAALLALSCGRPVLAPDLGAMRDLQDGVGEAWVRLYRDGLSAAELAAAARWASATPRPAAPDLGGRDWRELARETRAIYAKLTAGRRAAPLPRLAADG